MILRFISLFILLFFCSCAKEVPITSNAFADLQSLPYGFSAGDSFFVLPTQNNKSMLSKEVTLKIQEILIDKGYRAVGADYADYYLLFDFGMTSSRATINVPKYIPGQTQTTQGSVYGCYGYAGYQQQTQSSGSFIYVPEECVLFHKSLQIQVYDAKLFREEKQESQLWQGSANNSDLDNDLRNSIDYLLITAFKHFGRNTPKSLHVSMSSNDKEVKRLRRILS